MNSKSIVKTSVVATPALIVLLLCVAPSEQLQLTNWVQPPVNQPPGAILQSPQQFAPARQPITADLQNQVNALSAQIEAANRQLQYFQQQLSLIGQQPKQPELAPQVSQQVASPEASLAQQLALQQQQQQQLLAQQQQQQQQLAAALASQQQQQQPQFFAAQPQAAPQQPQAQQPQVSTLVDESAAEMAADQRFANTHQPQRIFLQQGQPQATQAQQQQFAAQMAAQQQQQQQQQEAQQQQFANQQATSTTVGPPSIETSLAAQEQQAQPQPQQPQQLAPPANMAPPHNPPKNDDKFSIGLGVLSPGYTQKFGNTALDFNQDKNGFSFTLSNNGHNNQVPTTTQKKPEESQ